MIDYDSKLVDDREVKYTGGIRSYDGLGNIL